MEAIWARLRDLEGQAFQTKKGLSFTFAICGDVMSVSRTDYNLTKRNFEKALELAPFDGPGFINDIIRGPAYVWAILHDTRVRRGDW